MKALIVDDSLVFRKSLAEAIRLFDFISEVKVAKNGKEALETAREYSPDFVSSDLEMPIMNGLEFIKEFRKINKKAKILVFSTKSQKGASITIEALLNGGDDFLAKTDIPKGTNPIEALHLFLKPKLEVLCKTKTHAPEQKKPNNKRPLLKNLIQNPKIIVVGSSTGGPEALKTFFSQLDCTLPVPLIVAQHMPANFTSILANMLNRIAKVEVIEAKDKVLLKPGHCYIAPGDYHLAVKRGPNGLYFETNQNEKVKFVRPSADVLFQSVAKLNIETVSIVFTGMGDDGVNGVISLKEMGKTHSIIQDKESSTVWGMPGAVFEAKAYDEILPLNQIGLRVNDFFGLKFKKSV